MLAPRRSPTSLAPTRVLVIEYDTDVRNLSCKELKEEGYQVLTSDHPVSPLNVQQLRPSLAVLDVILGGRPDSYGWRPCEPGPGRRGCLSSSAAATSRRQPQRRTTCWR
jgi:CheY-like chemotaxis protein